MPDTSIGPVALQEPATWSYDIDVTGVSRASYPGLVLTGSPLTQIMSQSTADLRYVLKAGDTMTGGLTIASTSDSSLSLNKSASGHYNLIWGNTAGSTRWVLIPGDQAAESGSNAGSDFRLQNYSDTGVYLGSPLVISRATGAVSMPAGITGNTTTAPAGTVGEVPAAVATLTGLVNSAWTSVNSCVLNLTAGDWDIWGVARISVSGACTTMGIGVSTVLNGAPVVQAMNYIAITGSTLGASILSSPQFPQLFSSGATWYLNVYVSGATSPTVNANDGVLYARRRR
jgi:hypothetical protein